MDTEIRIRTVDDVENLLDHIIYKPGWTFELKTWTGKTWSECYIYIQWRAFDSNDFPNYGVRMAHGFDRSVLVNLSDNWTELQLCRRIIDEVINLEAEMVCHDAREFFRINKATNMLPNDYPAPFHPHHYGDEPDKHGRDNWADTHEYGLIENESLPNYMQG